MQRSKKVVCLLGSTGFLGTTIVKRWHKSPSFRAKYEIRAIYRGEKSNWPKVFNRVFTEERKSMEEDEEESLINTQSYKGDLDRFAEFCKPISDINNKDDLKRVIQGSNFVIHCAGSYPEKCEEDKDELERTNVQGLETVLEVCLEINEESGAPAVPRIERLIYTSDLSTIVDYDNFESFTEESPLIDLNSKLITEYTRSKIRCEKLLEHIGDEEKAEALPVVILRPANMIGRFIVEKKFTSGEFMKKMLYGMFPGVPDIEIHLVHVDHVADAHLCALDSRKVPANRAYCLYDGKIKSDYISEYAKSCDWQENKRKKKYEGFHPSCLSISKLTCRLASIFVPEAKVILKKWGKKLEPNFAVSDRVFASCKVDSERAIIQMCDDIIESN
ncbi:unnamed protein product [Moneuplotes crassus]|uniref:NAD-dependent epimerase/dehydratase domain-containing protein n=1 Tax=Euplotes crassus TaxID=5936 RepID=A0AAD1XB51_EUPCR|nr:unnamed protein product [Moneuplotes crassus]